MGQALTTQWEFEGFLKVLGFSIGAFEAMKYQSQTLLGPPRAAV